MKRKRKIPYFYKTQVWYDLRALVLKRDKYKCFYCEGKAVTADHIIPRSKGGPDKASNLVGVCMECNRIAGGRLFDSLVEKAVYIRAVRGLTFSYSNGYASSQPTRQGEPTEGVETY
jgi:5-methylcytosine-specific restriction endonuclease McrA